MDKFVNATKLLKTVVFLLLGFTLSASSTNNREEAIIIEQRVYNLNTVVDLQFNDKVEDKIQFYVTDHRAISEVLLGRVTIYFPLFENVLREKGMPESLKYLPIIESGLRPDVTSGAGAAGLWQFMKPTARMFDLKINRMVDERRDPVKSTYAAAEYLQYLHDKYNDWTLAIAAYNCGPGNVNKAIRRSGSTNFWELEKYLPRETRNYIPKFIAATYLMNYYHEHDIIPQEPKEELKYTATAKVYNEVQFKDIADKFNLELSVIKLLNPSFLKNYIPSNEEGKYTFTLPENKLFEYLDSHGSYDDLVYIPVASRTVEKDKTIEELKTLPSVFSTRKVEIYNDFKKRVNLNNVEKEGEYIRLRRGETFQSYADKNGLSLKDLILLNDQKRKVQSLIRVK
jgi:membrane-bound lytic murein transglycosylase D